ncbi:MAG: pyridoxamine 5'-phosphate oxidase family protein [Candidatus Omnitrophota bacterium]
MNRQNKLSQAHQAFFKKQNDVIVCSLTSNSEIHCSVKNIIHIDAQGAIYLVDLYQIRTFANLKENPTVSITAIDEHLFIGYTIQGQAEIIEKNNIPDEILDKWEEKVTQKISKRFVHNLQNAKQAMHHPESAFPQPKCIIKINVDNIIDLTPEHLKNSK